MRYYLIAGEASGDLHGANLAREIIRQDSDADIRFWGGDNMATAIGHEPVKHIRDLAFMGFVEVLMNLRVVLGNIKWCKADVQKFAPDVLVFVDYPGFNLKIAEFAHKLGIKMAYYISPQLWAWKAGRVKKIKAWIHEMICILPFEVDWYAKHNVEVKYVGHPLLDVVKQLEGADTSITFKKAPIALVPGSRKQEISKMLPVMLQAAKHFPEEQFVITGAPAVPEEFYEPYLSKADNIQLVFGKTHHLMLAAKAAMVTSGTATLETALFNTPEVVCYKGSRISVWLAKKLIKVKYISLVNLILDFKLVEELIQSDFEERRLATELNSILFEDKREEILRGYETLRNKLGEHGASRRAAEHVVVLAASSR